MKKIFTLLFTISSFISFSQIDGHDCGFDEVYSRIKKENPTKWEEVLKSYGNLEEQIASYITAQKINGSKKSAVTYTIPVVFHVLHDGGPENISYEQIESAIDRLNECFSAQNPELSSVQAPFVPLIADLGIQFKLAKKAPDGSCFNGVTRTKTKETFSGNENAQLNAVINGNDVYKGVWRSDKYLNIFSVVTLSSPGAAAYATFPWGDGSDMSNGVWSQHTYLGSKGTSTAGRSGTVVHELGHWFALLHTWGNKDLVNNNPTPGDCSSSNDQVADTPYTIGNKTCSLGVNTCDGDNAYWGYDIIDNVENFMEYSYCFRMFTIGQRDRMIATLNSSSGGRNNLWTPSNLAATGVDEPDAICKADFSVDKQVICEGQTITFTDNSYSGPVSWTWTFTGADVTSSNQQNPTVTYSTAGIYNVSLQVSDGSNTASTTKQKLITVLPSPGNKVAFREGFETGTLPDINERWIINEDLKNDYSITSVASASGEKSLMILNSSSRSGNVYELTSSTYDFSQDNKPYISFKYAFAQRLSNNTDILRVYYSKDCGETFSLRYFISGADLPTSSMTTSTFVPEEEDWKQVIIQNISKDYAVPEFRVKFEFTSGGGNNFYIDDINLYGDVNLSISENNLEDKSWFYPNPANSNELKFHFESSRTSNVLINVYDIVGKKVNSLDLGNLQGNNDVSLEVNSIQSGTYLFETLVDGNPVKRSKIIIK